MDEAGKRMKMDLKLFKIDSAESMKQHRNTKKFTPNTKTSSVVVLSALGIFKWSCVERCKLC